MSRNINYLYILFIIFVFGFLFLLQDTSYALIQKQKVLIIPYFADILFAHKFLFITVHVFLLLIIYWSWKIVVQRAVAAGKLNVAFYQPVLAKRWWLISVIAVTDIIFFGRFFL